jgi:hypothetical protein
MRKAQFDSLLSDKFAIEEKWRLIKPHWENAKNTAYSRVVLLSMEKLYGIPDLTDETVGPLSKMIRESYQTPWYDIVLKEKCNIKYIIADVGTRRFEDPMFRYVEKFDEFVAINSSGSLEKIGVKYGTAINSLNALESTLGVTFEAALKRDIIAVKSTLAYSRTIKYENTSRPEAEKVFNQLIHSKRNETFDFSAVKPLQDYMMHQVIQMAKKHQLPMLIHTGLQAGDGNDISNANPVLLANLFLQYRDVKFVLFHGAYPYGGELSALAKNFQNVYIDMCWDYIISPSYSERYLHEWLETVPSNKIMAFGGDYHNIENVYGHLLFAKEIIANVLIEKVKDGYFSEEEAMKFAKMMLHDNAVNLFDEL